MVSVCIPFFLLILILQTQAAMQAVRKSGVAIARYLRRVLSELKSPAPPTAATEQVGEKKLGRRRFRRRQRSAVATTGAGSGGHPTSGGLRRAQSYMHHQQQQQQQQVHGVVNSTASAAGGKSIFQSLLRMDTGPRTRTWTWTGTWTPWKRWKGAGQDVGLSKDAIV